MLDFEARADALVTAWLLTLSLRYAPSLGPDNSDFTYEEAEFALGAGRRISLGRSALDLSILPGLATINLEWNQDEPVSQSGGITVLRLGLAARWSTAVSDHWRFTITADADLTPTELAHPTPLGPGAPAIPAWTGGLRLGASGEVL